ncbi:MAG: pyrroline-5-carboxylate reductase [Endomicrobia bacterium]|nr:pyrroline-5-carboxylate reductase [Endomicrobiia bacterium]
MKKVGIIGCGNMGNIILDAAVSLLSEKNVCCYDVDKNKLDLIEKKYNVKIAASWKDVFKNADSIIIAVKPQQFKDLIDNIKLFVKNHLIISIAAGVRISSIEKMLGKKVQIVRTMPNLPLKVSCGITAICKNEVCSIKNFNFTKELFSKKGIVLEVEEKDIDKITAISGSGPAYIFYISEIIQNVCKKLKLPSKIIEELVNYTILGAAEMLVKEYSTAKQLKDAVTSKGGTTQKALETLYKHNLENIFYKAINNAYLRAKELSEKI